MSYLWEVRAIGKTTLELVISSIEAFVDTEKTTRRTLALSRLPSGVCRLPVCQQPSCSAIRQVDRWQDLKSIRAIYESVLRDRRFNEFC